MFKTVINIIWWVNATKNLKGITKFTDERIRHCVKETVFVPTKANEVTKNRAKENRGDHMIA